MVEKIDFGNMTIGDIVRLKGTKAAELMDAALCDDGEKACCPGTTLALDFAARLKKKEDKLPELIQELEKLP